MECKIRCASKFLLPTKRRPAHRLTLVTNYKRIFLWEPKLDSCLCGGLLNCQRFLLSNMQEGFQDRRSSENLCNISNSYTFNICFAPNTHRQSACAQCSVHRAVNLSGWTIRVQLLIPPKLAKTSSEAGDAPAGRRTDKVESRSSKLSLEYIPESRAQSYSTHKIVSNTRPWKFIT